MKFIGQVSIVKEMEFLLAEIKTGANFNILFRAPSGHGKTSLAIISAQKLGLKNCAYYIAENEGIIINEEKRIQIIDEIHTIKEPEFLYNFLDCKKFTFFLLSNESGSLKEPLINRCIQFNFSPYTQDEINLMIKYKMGYFKFSEEIISEIGSRCKGNPRIAKVICERLNYVFKHYLIPKDLEELNKILNEILNIKEGGLTKLDEIYLEYLEKAGGSSSLSNIIYGTGIDRATILREIEPGLLYNHKIIINSKGRNLING